MRGIKPPKVLCHASVDKMVVQLVMGLKAAAGKMQKIRKSSSSLTNCVCHFKNVHGAPI
jgi:hypothetical protein